MLYTTYMTDESQHYYSNSIFWVEVDRIKPNPYQPRRTFDDAALASLADSIRQYGVLQPLTVTRKEIERSHEETDKMKLELAIIENLQREDLNPIDRAKAFQKLTEDFNMTHDDVGKKVGKSRVYVTNTLRILGLPEDMQQALADGGIMEGHTRPLLMLINRPEEQRVLFKEIIQKKTTVREAEQIARRIAVERTRKFDLPPELLSIEKQLTEKLGTRVRIEKREQGGKVLIDFFSPDDLTVLLGVLAARKEEAQKSAPTEEASASDPDASFKDSDDDLYSVKNFTV